MSVLLRISLLKSAMHVKLYDYHNYVIFQVDTSLQRLAAISNHLITALAELVSCESAASKQGAFKCFASLGANDEDIRKRIIEIEGLMVQVVAGMANPEPEASNVMMIQIIYNTY